MGSTNTLIVWTDGDPAGAVRFVVEGDTLWGDLGGGHRKAQHPLGGQAATDWLSQYYRDGYRKEYAERDAGQYYPRFYKGGYYLNLFQSDTGPEYDRDACAASFEQEEILVDELRSVCRVATPDNNTNSVYGSRIRNLLILASTEAEALMKGTLTMNGYLRADGKHLNMTDYLKLVGPMRLTEHEIRLTSYRQYAPFRPFGGWIDQDTKPDWYNAYNAAKHDREGSMPHARLGHAISAVAAVHTMLIAQYGEELRASSGFFQTTQRPVWSPTECTRSDRWAVRIAARHAGWGTRTRCRRPAFIGLSAADRAPTRASIRIRLRSSDDHCRA
jgi:hypothetical protein